MAGSDLFTVDGAPLLSSTPASLTGVHCEVRWFSCSDQLCGP